MKRYRILSFDFDSRAHSLAPAQEQWDEQVKKLHDENRKKAIEVFVRQFGDWEIDTKIKNFIDLKFKPFSILAFHNNFLKQVRNSFVIGSYYPALTSACSLGERILNHLVLAFRDYYKGTNEYKQVYRKDSFDNWGLAIDTLEAWEILLPNVVDNFRKLNEKRNNAIHFNPETDHNDRELALESVHLLQDIIGAQFSAFGTQPWLFIVPGECYIKKDWEEEPFVRILYLPNCALVGTKHTIESLFPRIVVNDNFEYDEREITDDEFIQLRSNRKQL